MALAPAPGEQALPARARRRRARGRAPGDAPPRRWPRARASSWSSRTRPAWRRSGKRCCGGSRGRASQSSRSSRGASTSRPGAWSGLPAGSGRHPARARRRGAGVGARGRSLPSLRGARRGDRGAGRSRPSSTTARRLFLEPLPLDVLPLAGAEGGAFGARRQAPGELARLPGTAVADRLGADGAEAWRLARGRATSAAPSAGRAGGDAGVSGTCERAHARAGTRGADRASARPPGAGRPGSQAARHLGEARRGGSWRSSLTLREPTAEPDRLRLALAPGCRSCRLRRRSSASSWASSPSRSGRRPSSSVPEGAACASACAEGCARCARR